MTVTVIVPVWDDYVKYISRCVQELTGPGIKVLVIDNASKVPLPELEGADVLVIPNRISVGRARNLAIDQVETEYVMFCDADDSMVAGGIAKMVAALEGNPQATLAAGYQQTFDVEANRVLDRPPRYPDPGVTRWGRYPNLMGLRSAWKHFLPIAGNAVYRTALVKKAGGFGDGDLGEDWEFITAYAFSGPLVLVPEVVKTYRQAGGSLSNKPVPRQAVSAFHKSVRRRLKEAATVPRWVRLLLPVLALKHAWWVRQNTPGGMWNAGEDNRSA